uniref:Uncharacterized protein n=1 Tax=Octopus bimaculoides TaxID=37653 RepID=A0A0L8GEX8_OCTBM
MKAVILILCVIAISQTKAYYYRHGGYRRMYRPPQPPIPPIKPPLPPPVIPTPLCPGNVAGKLLFCSPNCAKPNFVPVSGVPGCYPGLTCCTQA